MTWDLIAVRCAQCKCNFGIPPKLEQTARCSEKISFHCPYGHSNYYPKGETEEAKLRRENQRLVQQMAHKDDQIKYERDRKDKVERRLIAQRGVTTRIKNRIGRGVCPCCDRTFQNVAQHMASQHKEYHAEDADAELRT